MQNTWSCTNLNYCPGIGSESLRKERKTLSYAVNVPAEVHTRHIPYRSLIFTATANLLGGTLFLNNEPICLLRINKNLLILLALSYSTRGSKSVLQSECAVVLKCVLCDSMSIFNIITIEISLLIKPKNIYGSNNAYKFEVLTTVSTKFMVLFWDMTPYSLIHR
jgi:hypothetical protein